MGRSRASIIEQCNIVKELYDSGYTVKEIAESIGMSKESVRNSFNIMGISLKKPEIDETNLIYADNSVKLEKLVLNGKRYTDITQLFAPR